MRINQNIAAQNAHRMLSVNSLAMEKSMERLTSGLKINRASDDAAGLSISEKMRAQIRGMNQASSNAQNAIMLTRSAEGQLDTSHEILQRMRELAVAAADDGNEDLDRAATQAELNQLATELSRISETAEYNNIKLLDGSFSNKQFQIGANAGQSISLTINKMDATSLGVANATNAVTATNAAGDEVTLAAESTSLKAGNYTIADISSHAVYTNHDFGLMNSKGEIVALGVDGADNEVLADISTWVDINDTSSTLVAHSANANLDLGSTFTAVGEEAIDATSSSVAANQAITAIDDAIKGVSAERSKLGAIENRLTYTVKNLDLTSENLAAAESRIRDVDVAAESMALMRQTILQQSSMSMLAQANMLPQNVLRLLG